MMFSSDHAISPNFVPREQMLTLLLTKGTWWNRVRSDMEMQPCDKFIPWHDRASQEDTFEDPDQEFDIGDGMDRPMKLWGFSSECPTPAVLLACRESRDVALKDYQPLFSSLGALPQVYFDPLRDTLFIDHETFMGDYDGLPRLIRTFLLPNDLSVVRKLAVEGLGPYNDNQGSFTSPWYGEYLLYLCLISKGQWLRYFSV
jgi:2EXR family